MPIRKPMFVVPLSLGTIATGNEASGFPASNLGETDAAGLVWKSSGATNVWARGQMTSAQSINFAALMSANAIGTSTKLRLRLGTSQAQVDGTAPYDSGAVNLINPTITRSDGLYHSHLELPSTVSASWWRIDITGHTGDFQASSLVLGQAVQSSRFYNPDFEFGAEDMSEVEFSRFGVPDITPGAIMRTLGFTLEWQSEAEFEATFRPIMETRGRTKPLWVCLDPDATTYRQAKTYLGFLRKVPYATGQRKPGLFSQEFNVLSLY